MSGLGVLELCAKLREETLLVEQLVLMGKLERTHLLLQRVSDTRGVLPLLLQHGDSGFNRKHLFL